MFIFEDFQTIKFDLILIKFHLLSIQYKSLTDIQ